MGSILSMNWYPRKCTSHIRIAIRTVIWPIKYCFHHVMYREKVNITSLNHRPNTSLGGRLNTLKQMRNFECTNYKINYNIKDNNQIDFVGLRSEGMDHKSTIGHELWIWNEYKSLTHWGNHTRFYTNCLK